MNLFANRKRIISAFTNEQEVSRIRLGDVKLFPRCTFHPPTGENDDLDDLNITQADIQKVIEQNTYAREGQKQKLEITFTPEQQAFMHQLAEFLFPNGDDGGGGNEGGDDVPSTTTTFTLDDGSVEEYEINGVLDNDWMVANGFKTITDGRKTWVKNIVKASIGTEVTAIGPNAFQASSSLVKITIPNGVTDIGDYAFYLCSSLTSITMGDGVTNIGSYAFYGCSGLTRVTIPNSVTSISNNAFSGCSGLTSVTIPDSVTSIGGNAFSGCSGLVSLTIGSSVTSIGEYAFSGCRVLTSMTIPPSVTHIGFKAFYNCQSLAKLAFLGKTMDEVLAMDNCPWGIQDRSIISVA